MKERMDNFVEAAKTDEVVDGASKLLEIDGVRIALFNLAGNYYAIEDVCTHDGGPLVEGEVVNGCEVICPRHGARFDIRTGAALSFPAFEATNVYEVREQDGVLYIEPPF